MINDMKIRRKDGSVGTARSMKIATARELDGLDILTWPSLSPIWPDPSAYSLDDSVEADWLDLSNTFKYASLEIRVPSLCHSSSPLRLPEWRTDKHISLASSRYRVD